MTDSVGPYIYNAMAETHIFNGLQLRKLKICGSNLIAHGHGALDRLSWKKSLTRDLGTRFVEEILY